MLISLKVKDLSANLNLNFKCRHNLKRKKPMDKWISMLRKLILLAILLGSFSTACQANWFTPETAVLAQQALPLATATLNDMTRISKSASGLLYLPKGAAKIGLSVLPGPTIKGGLRDISRGIHATSNLVGNTLRLPVKLADRSLKKIGSISPLSLAGL